jgi:hypothetical protein
MSEAERFLTPVAKASSGSLADNQEVRRRGPSAHLPPSSKLGKVASLRTAGLLADQMLGWQGVGAAALAAPPAVSQFAWGGNAHDALARDAGMLRMVAIQNRSKRGPDPMRHYRPGLALICGVLLLPVACSSSPSPERIAGDLTQRLDVLLAPELASGQAGVQRLPDGARVTLADGTVFSVGGATLNDKGRYTVASVIEALLEPRLLQIEVAGSPTAAAPVQESQAHAVTTFFLDYGIAATTVAPQPLEAPGAGAPVVTITIRAVPV